MSVVCHIQLTIYQSLAFLSRTTSKAAHSRQHLLACGIGQGTRIAHRMVSHQSISFPTMQETMGCLCDIQANYMSASMQSTGICRKHSGSNCKRTGLSSPRADVLSRARTAKRFHCRSTSQACQSGAVLELSATLTACRSP